MYILWGYKIKKLATATITVTITSLSTYYSLYLFLKLFLQRELADTLNRIRFSQTESAQPVLKWLAICNK